MNRLVVATGNPGKLREFAAALDAAGVEVVGLDALDDREPVVEDGATFEANARLKAEAYSRRTSLPPRQSTSQADLPWPVFRRSRLAGFGCSPRPGQIGSHRVDETINRYDRKRPMRPPMRHQKLHEENRLSWNHATPAHNSHKADQARFLLNGTFYNGGLRKIVR